MKPKVFDKKDSKTMTVIFDSQPTDEMIENFKKL